MYCININFLFKIIYIYKTFPNQGVAIKMRFINQKFKKHKNQKVMIDVFFI